MIAEGRIGRSRALVAAVVFSTTWLWAFVSVARTVVSAPMGPLWLVCAAAFLCVWGWITNIANRLAASDILLRLYENHIEVLQMGKHRIIPLHEISAMTPSLRGSSRSGLATYVVYCGEQKVRLPLVPNYEEIIELIFERRPDLWSSG